MGQADPLGHGPWMEDDDPWLLVATGSDLSDLIRGRTLTSISWRTKGLVRDEELQQRYKDAGIEHVFLVVSVADPDVRRRSYFRRSRAGDQLYAEADVPDDPSIPPGSEEFDIWLEPQARQVLESYKALGKR